MNTNNQERKIFGICGIAGSGKNTVGKILEEKGFITESFARPLKRSVGIIFGWDENMLSGNNPESREWREKRDEWWSNELGFDVIPREVLRYFGTDLLRKYYHPDIWIKSLEKTILDNNTYNYVITDCRFPNEIRHIHNLGGKMIWVRNEKLPEWTNIAFEFKEEYNNNGYETDHCKKLRYALEHKYGIHETEWIWIGEKFDNIIWNISDIDTLYKEVDRILE